MSGGEWGGSAMLERCHKNGKWVELSVYDSSIVKELKEIQGAYFQKPFWIISIEHLSLLQNKLEKFKDWVINETLDTVN